MAAGLLASGILGPIIGGSLADICQRASGPRRTVIVLSSLICLTTPCAFFASVPSLWATIVLFGAFTTAVSAAAVMGTTLFTIAIPDEVRGLCMAVMSGTSILFAGVLAPLAVSELTTFLGGPQAIGISLTIVGTGVCILGASSFYSSKGHFPKNGELACALRSLEN